MPEQTPGTKLCPLSLALLAFLVTRNPRRRNDSYAARRV